MFVQVVSDYLLTNRKNGRLQNKNKKCNKNLLFEEADLQISIVQERKDVIENKKMNGVTEEK